MDNTYYIDLADPAGLEAWIDHGGTNNTTATFERTQCDGYCFDCDKEMPILYYPYWYGTYPAPRECCECGGNDVAFIDRLAKHLLEKIGVRA